MLFALLLTVASTTQRTFTDIQARIEKTPFVVSLALDDWKEVPADGNPLGDKLLLSGSIAPSGSLLTVIVEPNEPPISPKTWRERLAPPGKPFDVEFTPCIDSSQELVPGMRQSDYHAYFATRTHVLDVHVSRMTDGQGAFPREEFERIVRSLRVLLLRRGWNEDYPNEVAVPMTLASILGVDQKQWTESYFVKHAEEWPANFANAEFLHYLKAPLERQLAAYDKALALIAKVEKPDAKVRFAAAMLHEGRGLALYDAKRYDDSIAPQAEGYKILSEIGRKERGALAYNLACSHALAKHREPALDFLKKAVEVDPRFRESAARDADFTTLAGEAEFKKLIAPPAPAPPQKKN